MDQEVINKAKEKLAELELKWKEDLRKEYKGGLNNNINTHMAKLRVLIRQGEEENNV